MSEWYDTWHDGSKKKPCHNEKIEAVLFVCMNERGDRVRPPLHGRYDAQNNQIFSALGTADWDEVVFWRELG